MAPVAAKGDSDQAGSDAFLAQLVGQGELGAAENRPLPLDCAAPTLVGVLGHAISHMISGIQKKTAHRIRDFVIMAWPSVCASGADEFHQLAP